MAQGVPILYGECVGGPWNKKHLAHHETPRFVPIDEFSKKIHVGVVPGTAGYKFGKYDWDGKAWHWSPPPGDSK